MLHLQPFERFFRNGQDLNPVRTEVWEKVVLWWLLSDTELGEDIAQDLIGGDFSGDLAEVV
jgi:hypothetical protein